MGGQIVKLGEVIVKGSIRQLNLDHSRYEQFNKVEQFHRDLNRFRGIIKDTETKRLHDNALRRMYFIQFDFLPDEIFLQIDLLEKSNGIRIYVFTLRSIENKINALHAQWLLTAIQSLFIKGCEFNYKSLKKGLLGVELPPNRLINMNDYQSTP